MGDELGNRRIEYTFDANTKQYYLRARYYDTHAAPPVMGLVFEDAVAGQDLFSGWAVEHGNSDPFDEIRIAIIEGDIEKMHRPRTKFSKHA